MSDGARAKAQAAAREYLRTRGTLAPPGTIRDRIAASFEAFEALVAPLTASQAARVAVPGEWSVHEIVDHLVETHRPGLDELRCLLSGHRPPGEPIPAGLQSKMPLLRPWGWLLRELRQVHEDILATLDGVPADFATDARAPLIMVVDISGEGGTAAPFHWVEDLDWKSYALVWRLHVVDHLNQARKVLAAAGSR